MIMITKFMIVITIMVSLVIGFCLGVLSTSKEIQEKDQQVEELLGIVEKLMK